MGLASAWALRRAGRDVTVLEQFEVGHPYGSSHGASRIFRFAYSETEWVALAQEALPLWRELEEESGTELLSLTGLLDSSGDSAAASVGARRVLGGVRGARRRRSRAAVRHRARGRGRARAARRHRPGRPGARRLLPRHPGRDRSASARASAQARTACRSRRRAGPIEAALAVVAAGAWATPLLADAGIELETNVSQETVAYFDLPAADTLPSVIDWNEETGRHAYSLSAGENILKVGLHHSGVPVEPGERGEPDPEVVEAASEWVRRRYPAADPSPRGAETCLYTNIDDDGFVIERHGAIIGCSACSGPRLQVRTGRRHTRGCARVTRAYPSRP